MRWLSALVLMLPAACVAAECTARSGPATNALVELYTSEGCSSCPPADRWLSTLRAEGVVPIGFHISYWDYIGWKDAYADERFTQRQKDLARMRGAGGVYTPQVVLAGADYRSWPSERAVRDSIASVRATPAAARIELTAKPARDGVSGVASARAMDGSLPSAVALVVAITQDGISSRVTAGENKGEKLDHNFVARDIAVIRPSGDKLEGAFAFKPKANWDLERMRIVAFVQDLRTGKILQALAAPPCR